MMNAAKHETGAVLLALGLRYGGDSQLPVNQRFLPVSKVLVRWATKRRGTPKPAAVKGAPGHPYTRSASR
jgi:hypothetical protein